MKKSISGLLVIILILSSSLFSASAAYENTHTNTGNQRTDIIAVAKTQVGNTNGLKYRSDGASWCAAFIVWCARQANIGSSIIKNTGWATAYDLGVTYYGRNADRSNSITYTPKSGDIIIFDWSSNGYCYKSPPSYYGDHVGLVEYVENGYVHTIEGNSGNPGIVRRKSYSLSSSEIKGYGVPDYEDTEQERHSVITTWAAPVGQESPILSEGLVNTQYQFWYRMLDSNTGDLYNSYSNTNYSATIYVYNPDGSVLYSYNYGRSDNNWIRCTPTKVGTYKITVKVTGNIEAGYTREFKVTSDGKVVMSPSTLNLNLASKPSGTVNISLSGNWPDDAVYEFSKSNNNIQYTQNGSVLTVTGVKTGSTDLKIKIYAKGSGTTLAEFTTKVNVSTNTLKVYYKANGGAISSDSYKLSSDVICNKSDSSQFYQTWTYNNPKEKGLTNASTFGIYKTGYSFAGWGTKTSGGTVFDDNDPNIKPADITTNIKNGNCSITLHAQWKPNMLSLYYNINGGSISSDKYTVKSSVLCYASSGEKVNGGWYYNTGDENGLYNPGTFGIYKTGYSFAGWGTTASGGTVFDQNDSTLKPTDINANIKNGDCSTTLYAQWKANSYKIAFNGNGATGGSMSNLAITYGSAKNLTANGFSKTGYTFKGWNTKADGTGAAYADRASVKNLTSTNNGTVTLYAQWTQNHSHSYTSKVTTAPTCTQSGVKTFTCSCGDSYTQSISSTGHSYVTNVITSTCTEQGYTKTTCKNCSYISINSFVPTTGHTYSEWVTTIQPTTTQTGLKTKTCHCGAKVTETIPKLTATEYFVDFEKESVNFNYKDKIQLQVSTNSDKVIYSSSDTSVAVVNENGLVTAVGTGNATITATVEGTSISDTCEINSSYAWWQWIILILLFGFIWY